MIMIPAQASMSTHCLHLSGGAAWFCGCKITAFFVLGNKSAANLAKISILHLVTFHLPSLEGLDGLVMEQWDEWHCAMLMLLL